MSSLFRQTVFFFVILGNIRNYRDLTSWGRNILVYTNEAGLAFFSGHTVLFLALLACKLRIMNLSRSLFIFNLRVIFVNNGRIYFFILYIFLLFLNCFLRINLLMVLIVSLRRIFYLIFDFFFLFRSLISLFLLILIIFFL